jgi:VCBS repeat-containing protein
MATVKVIGRVEVSVGNVRIVDVDGNLRDTGYDGLMYEGEQIYSDDVNALFQIKYLALPEATAYDGIFRVLADGSVIAGLEGNENFFGEDIDFMETAAGDAGVEGSSAFLEEVPVDESSLLGFGRGADDTGYGGGIVNFVEVSDTDGTPPVITSDNEVIFDENDPDAVMTITALDTSALTFSISGLDSALFSIDPVTGVLRFNDAPDYENPLDAGGDNEYNLLVTVTDALGNFTTQLLSINVNNLNDNIPTAEDAANSAVEDGVVVSGQLVGEDADGNEIRYELGEDTLGEDEGTLVFNSDGSYTYDVGDDFQDLADGESRIVNFTYKTVEVGPPLSEPSDAGPFESIEATVTIVITGTNDRPVVKYLHDGGTEADGTQIFDGQLVLHHDVDFTDTHTFEIDSTNQNTTVSGGYEGAGTPNTVFNVGTGEDPIYAKVISSSDGLDSLVLDSIVVDSDGAFHITGDFDALAEGETATIRFRYVAVDDSGVGTNPALGESDTSKSKMVEMTIMGTNDAPMIMTGETGLTFISESAGYNNVLGIYVLDEAGNPTDPQIIMTDTNSGGAYTTPIDLAFGSFGLFILPNGDYDGIEEATLSFDGTQLLIDGNPVNVYYDNNDWNPSGLDHFDIIANADGSVNIKVEDLNLGDNDRNDLQIKLTPIGGSVGGTVVELADGHEGEGTALLTTDGTLDFDDLDISDIHTVSVVATPNGEDYIGTFSASITTPATGDGVGEISWDYSVLDGLLDPMGQYDSVVQTYTVTVDDGHGGTDTQVITITLQGTNDAPEVMAENITKVADNVTTTDIPSGEDVTAMTFLTPIIPFLPPLLTSDDAEVHIKTHGRYAVDDQNVGFLGFGLDGDKEQFIDSKGFWNEGILFDFDSPVSEVTIGFQAFGNHDRALVQLYNDNGDVVGFRYVTSHNNLHQITIDEGVSFSKMGVFALDSINVTDFRITSISAMGEMDTVLPFVIDDSMLLANDTDAEGDAIHVELVDGKLLDAGGTEIGTVTINGDGDIQVTPDADVDFDTSVAAYANFAYVVVDEHGATSEATTATIDVAVGTVVGSQVGYVPDGPQEFIIGTDSDAVDALSDNVLTVSDTLDLSHVSTINTIELGEDATVTGSADLGHITAADVMDATDLDNTLVIQSTDGNAHDQVDVHESFGDASTVFSDGQWYAEYSADGATLLVEIDPPIDIV